MGRWPAPLAEGARIGVFAPGHTFRTRRLEAGLRLLREAGWSPVPAPHLEARHRRWAGTVEERAADLRWALGSQDLDAAWMVRGGSGALRLLPELDGCPSTGRPLVGFSDGTALLAGLARRGEVGVHGPVVHSLPDTRPEDRERLFGLLRGERGVELAGRQVRPGGARGPVVGGNLAVLAALAGTPWQPDLRGAILVLEDAAEADYRLVRAVDQLAAAGALEGVAAVALGTLRDCAAPPGASWTAEELLLERLAELGVPLAAGLPVGHGEANAPFVHGATGTLEGGVLRQEPPRAPRRRPRREGGAAMDIDRILARAVEEGTTLGAALSVRLGGREVLHRAAGRARADPDVVVERATPWDLASVTKPLVGGLLAVRALAEGRLRLDQPLARWFPEAPPGVEVGHLLAHVAGYPDWRPLHLRVAPGDAGEGTEAVRMAIIRVAAATPLEAPPGARARYSDIGFIALCGVLEAVWEARIDAAWDERVAGPAGLALRWGDPRAAETDAALPPGAVHDPNARAMGGVSTHAGLFGTAAELAEAGERVLEALAGGGPLAWEGLQAELLRPLPGTHRLGFDTVSPSGSSVGDRFPRDAVGHLGFTGCSLWISPSAGCVVALCTNRVRTGAGRKAIHRLRRAVHDAVAEHLLPPSRLG